MKKIFVLICALFLMGCPLIEDNSVKVRVVYETNYQPMDIEFSWAEDLSGDLIQETVNSTSHTRERTLDNWDSLWIVSGKIVNMAGGNTGTVSVYIRESGDDSWQLAASSSSVVSGTITANYQGP